MIVGIANSKGGVGKTTISVHLAELFAKNGREVIAVDADAQGSLTDWLQEANPKITIHRLVSADDLLDRVPEIQAKNPNAVIVIDGPAGIGEATRSIMCLADLVIIPLAISRLDMEASEKALQTLRQVRVVRKGEGGKPDAVIIPNQTRETAIVAEFRGQKEKDGVPILGEIKRREVYIKANFDRKFVWDFKDSAANAASAELDLLFTELQAFGK